VPTAFDNLPPPRALVFDWDNTLVDTWGVIHDALNTTLTAFNHQPWTLDETRQRVRGSMRDSFPGLFGDKWEDAAGVFYARYAEIHTIKLEATDGAEDMLSALATRDFYMAVVSNKTGSYLRAEADHLDWTRFFSRIVGAMDAERDKPAPDPIVMALSDGGIAPGPDVWYIGDADIDMNFAHRAGCVPVLVRKTPPETAEFDDFPPWRHFSDCRALCKFIDNL